MAEEKGASSDTDQEIGKGWSMGWLLLGPLQS